MTMQDPKQSIYAYRTKVAPNVSLPNAAKKPPAREQAMLDLISEGYTPGEAMARLERADGHKRLFPERPAYGTLHEPAKTPKRNVGLHFTGIMRLLTDSWTTSSTIAQLLKQNKIHVQYDMFVLANDGQIERRRKTSHSPYEFRRVQK